MKKIELSINYKKLEGLANDKGYINLVLVQNEEKLKTSGERKDGSVWELWETGFITTKAPKDEKGIIVGNSSEFRNKETVEETKVDTGEVEDISKFIPF